MSKDHRRLSKIKQRLREILLRRSKLDTHLAVFGESGSGKTTLLAAFYGCQQSAEFRRANSYSLLARDTTQGQQLLAAYYRIENDRLPLATRFNYTEYDFEMRAPGAARSVANLRWYDYPGEWWTETPKDEEADRKKEIVSRLIHSDVAILLLDGAQYKNGEPKYIRKTLSNFRDEIQRQRQLLLKEGDKLVQYPNIWVIALSKADLYPGHTAEKLRSTILQHAQAEVELLRSEIGVMIAHPETLSFGDEYLLLSAAEFDSNGGSVVDHTKTIGIELLVPIAMSAPITHSLRRIRLLANSQGAAASVLKAVIRITTSWMKFVPIAGGFFDLADEVFSAGVDKLKEVQERALRRGDNTGAILAKMRGRILDDNSKAAYCGIKLDSSLS